MTLSSIIFDLDETLIDREATMRKFLIGQRQRLSHLIDCNDANYADVGDNPVNDIEPANKLGMVSIWVENPNFHAPQEADAIISNISDLSDTIGRLSLK